MQFPAWVLLMLTPSESGRHGCEYYLYAGDAYLLKRKNNTIIKQPMEHETPPTPTIVKKMRTFLEVEGKWLTLQLPAIGHKPQCQGGQGHRKRKRAAPPPKDLGQQPPNLVKQLHTHHNNFQGPNQCKTPSRCFRNRPLPLEDALVCKSTPWPSVGKTSGNSLREGGIGCFLPTT